MQLLSLEKVRHAVVVAPHSDDETIGAFHAISALRKRGARVDVVVMTDGSASHRNSATFPTPRLVSARKSETINAMKLAGVGKGSIEFLGLPDGGLDTLSRDQYRAAVTSLRRRPVPDLLILPTVNDDHPDHRNTAHMCHGAWSASIPRLCYKVWPSTHICPLDRQDQTEIIGNVTAKRLAISRYKTQLGLIDDDPDGFSLTELMLRRMCTARERFTCV